MKSFVCLCAVLFGLTTLRTQAKVSLNDLDSGVELDQSFVFDPHAITAAPGALEMSLNATSIQNLIGTFIPIMSYYAFNNQTFYPDINDKHLFWKLKVKKIHVNTVSGFTSKIFEQIDNDHIHVRIGGIDIDMDVDGEVDALRFIPLKASHVNVTDLTLDFVLESKSSDGVHWALSDKTAVTVKNVKINMKSKILNFFVKINSWLINDIIKHQLKKVGKLVDSEVKKINAMIANEGPYTFASPMFGNNTLLNLTMTTAPFVGNDNIDLVFDGTFEGPEGSKCTFDMAPIAADPVRIPHALSNQVWIHQNTLNSYLDVAEKEIFPVVLRNESISERFLKSMPELKTFFGENATIAMQVSLKNPSTTSPLTLDTKTGFTFGANNDLQMIVELLGSNDTVKDTNAAKFKMNFMGHFNFTLYNMVLYPNVRSINVSEVSKVTDIVGLNEKNFDQIFKIMFQTWANNVNIDYSEGWALSNLNPQLGLITGIIKNSTVTPFVQDEWLWAGFTMEADKPTAEEVVLEFI
mmetsp:Transcript_4449/g.6582  ORF Transcript_4449/g.6582 Transcript_4449/m.6582 type:complete len:522 (+) Transcript_4449:3-1568(+)